MNPWSTQCACTDPNNAVWPSGAVATVCTMTASLVALVLNSRAPQELAAFWAHALQWETGIAGRLGIELLPRDTTSFSLIVRRTEEGHVGQNRIHFDLTTTSSDDQATSVTELLAMGATHVDIGQTPEETHVVLADSEGNEFCIIDPDSRFLAGCPRLGAVNCDGTHALGAFWSEALGWPLVWDQDEETAIQAPGFTGPKITWSGPPLMPRSGREPFHFHIAPSSGTTLAVTLDHLLALGATRLDIGQACPDAISLADVDGNEFCLVPQ